MEQQMALDTKTLEVKMEQLHSDVGEIKDALGKLSAAIVKLALIEERQTVASASLERAFAALERVEGRVSELERASITSKRTSGWVDRAVVAGIGVIAIIVLKKVGLL